MADNLKKILSETLEISAEIKSKKDIGEAAIQEYLIKRSGKAMKNRTMILKIGVTAVCAFAFVFTGMLLFSDNIRTVQADIIRNIFTLNKQGNSYEIIQKNVDDETSTTNFSGILTEEFAMNEVVDKLGFEPFIPEKIGEFKTIFSYLGLCLNGKTSELNLLDNDAMREMLKNYPNDDRLKGFNAVSRFTILFSKNGDILDDVVLNIHMSKPPKQPFHDDSISTEKNCEFSYNGVDCECVTTVTPDYALVYGEQSAESDRSQQPTGIIKIKRVNFNIDGIDFAIGYQAKGQNEEAFDYELTKKFTEDFIDAYKLSK